MDRTIDEAYLIRELKDSLRGIDLLPKSLRKKHFNTLLDNLLDECVTMHPVEVERSIRWGSSVTIDCTLLDRGITNSIDRFLKGYA